MSHPRRGSDLELGMDAGGRSAGLRINSGLACADPGVGLDAGQRYAALTLADAAQACELPAACRVLQHGCGATLGEAQIPESGLMLADAPQARRFQRPGSCRGAAVNATLGEAQVLELAQC